MFLPIPVVLPLLFSFQAPGTGGEGFRVVPERLEAFHRRITSRVRLAGSEGSRAAARDVARVFEKAGLRIERHVYEVLLSRNEHTKLRLRKGAGPWRDLAPLAEDGVEADADSFHGDIVPPQIAYAPSGKVRGEVVYVNYGLPEDYEALEARNIETRGRILIARYGKSFRGVKLRLAETHGALALLIYSDPADDGFTKGDPLPRGTMRPGDGVQRGSPLYIFRYPGDPLTPGRPAIPGVERIPIEKAANLPAIPATALAARHAAEILAALGGEAAPRGWQGGLPFTYHLGPGPARIELELENPRFRARIVDVIGVLEGKSGPHGDFVMLGNHRDSWVHGGIDAGSGTACLLEAATVLGARARGGWKPDRTIRFASWDGEEFGVIGSTEYGEQFEDFLAEHLVAYVNADSVVSGGDFGASATASLRDFARETAAAVLHPRKAVPLTRIWKGRPGLLGGGSDFMVFLDRLGVPCVQWGMSGPTGVYHSSYDTHAFVASKVDPGFLYHATVTKVLVRALGVLASERARVFDPLDALRDLRSRLEDRKPRLPGKTVEALLSRIHELIVEGEELQEAKVGSPRAWAGLDRSWLASEGLEGRPWFRNLLVAPGLVTGYAAVLLPELEEALERNDAPATARALERLGERLEAFAEGLDRIAAERGNGGGR